MQERDGRWATVALIGAGNFGRRHLDGLLLAPEIDRIVVVERDKVVHSQLRQLYSDQAQLEVLPAPDQTRRNFDLLIVATNAPERYLALRELRTWRTDVLLLEKPLANRVEEFDKILDESKRYGMCHVNFVRRSLQPYQELKREVARQGGPISMEVSGSGWNLLSNASHFVDLGEFLSASRLEGVDTLANSVSLGPSRRAGLVELFGTLTFHYGNGMALKLHCESDIKDKSYCIRVRTRTQNLTIDEGACSRPDMAKQTINLQPQSTLSSALVQQLTGPDPLLPTLHEVSETQRLLTGILEGILGQILTPGHAVQYS